MISNQIQFVALDRIDVLAEVSKPMLESGMFLFYMCCRQTFNSECSLLSSCTVCV